MREERPIGPELTETVSVGYPGRDGAHSAAACERLFPHRAAPSPPSFAAVAEAISERSIEFGVLPIESSALGPGRGDARPPVRLAARHHRRDDAPDPSSPRRPGRRRLEDIRVVHSHPVALDQCRRLLASMPQATAIAAATTGDAAAHVAEHGDASEAAIASERAAKLYGLTVIAADVGDHPEAYTRFVSIATHMRLDKNGKPWRTAFSFVTDHQPGALHRAIEPFAATASTSTSSSRARSRTRPGATASTPCSQDTRSTPSCARRSPTSARGRGSFASSAPTLQTSSSERPRLRSDFAACEPRSPTSTARSSTPSTRGSASSRSPPIQDLERHPVRRPGARAPAPGGARLDQPRPALGGGPAGALLRAARPHEA